MSNVVFHAGEGIQTIGKSVDIVQQNIPDGGFRCQFNQTSFSPSSHCAGEMHAARGFTSTRQNEAVNWGDGVHCAIDRVFQRSNFFRTDVTLLR